MPNGIDGKYWDRMLETGKKIERIDSNVSWLCKETKKQNVVLQEHEGRIRRLEDEGLARKVRESWVRSIFRPVLGAIGIKI